MITELLTEQRLAEDSVKLMQVMLSKHPDVKHVIGVPRSGLIPAAIIAAGSGLQLGSLSQEGEPIWLGGGRRSRSVQNNISPGDKVCVIDDSVNTGKSMYRVIQDLKPEILRQRHNPLAEAEVIFASVYCTRDAQEFVDLHAVDLEMPHWFTWHLFGSKLVGKIGFDMDGVLCEDCPRMDNYDSPEGIEWLNNTKPKRLLRPSKPRAIITARCHIYREQTERWLKRYGVHPRELIMGPWASGKERARDNVCAWKAEQITRLGLDRFVESDARQAKAIHRITGIEVICTDTCEVFY